MHPEIPLLVWFVAIGVNLALAAAVVLMARRAGGPHGKRAALMTGAALVVWLAAVAGLGQLGWFESTLSGPPKIGPAIALPILGGAIALFVSERARAFVARIPRSWLIGTQVLRLVGLVFLFLEARALLPAHFAEPAGWGDALVGASAPLVALAVARGLPSAGRWAAIWNVAGVLDLAVAVGIGALSTESSIRVFESTPSTGAMAVLPLSLIPTFGVPIFVLLHVASWIALRSRRGELQEASATARASAARHVPGVPSARAGSPTALRNLG